MKYPKPLKKGDIIGVCAPSAGVNEGNHARLELAVRNVETMGYRVVVTDSVRRSAKCVSADAETRAREFMSLYTNPEVAAIIPPWGGEFLMEILPLLDFDELSKSEPKWVCGYSDITTLLFPMTIICDVATLHGSNFMNLGAKTIHESDLRLFEALREPTIIQRSAARYGGYTKAGEDGLHESLYALDKPSKWKSVHASDREAIEGRIIGGCLDTLGRLVGTKYAPVVETLHKRYWRDGLVWTLESCEMNAAEIYRSLWQLREVGWFEYTNGIVIGRPDGYSDTQDFTLRDAIDSALGGLQRRTLESGMVSFRVPVFYDADFGHVPPQMQLINGAYARIECGMGSAVVMQGQKVFDGKGKYE
ncbi:MAG: LD-carboxypeptidase [Oscillospiraceae bacterium]|jgi:muramoyltetrapeptide carboxypeptidase LdcA involved in peptidoglycan recycling|nr:LD-carboxypeptidase [Oscillospiraceae bacterium]